MRTASGCLTRELTLSLILCLPLVLRILSACFLTALYSGHSLSEPLSNAQCADERLLPIAAQRIWGTERGKLSLVLQISDLHLNSNTNSTAHRSLSHFLSHELPVWTPIAHALLITGDLVHAMHHPSRLAAILRLHRSRQSAAEWRAFATAVNSTALPVLPVFGNHDVVGGITASHCTHGGRAASMFKCNGEPHASVYRHRVSSALSVVGLDATARAALHAPLNFFGELSAQTLSELDTTLTEIHADDPDAVTLLFSHYPASIISGGAALASLARGKPRARFAAHLSGHLHTLRGAAPRGLQTLSRDGYIEAQLPDLVYSRRFRVLAVDHGVLSFHDLDVATEPNAMPHIVVTNPPAARLCIPGAGAAAMRSTHVRFIVVRPSREAMSVFIDNHHIGHAERVCDDGEALCGALFHVRWDAYLYDDGHKHVLHIRDTDGAELHAHNFSLRGQHARTRSERMAYAAAAVMTLTPFDAVLPRNTLIALITSAILLIAAALAQTRGKTYRRCAPLALYLLNMVFGPVIISDRLRTAGGFGYAGFFFMRLGGVLAWASPDAHLWMSGPVLWNTVLPLSLFVYLEARGTRTLSTVTGTAGALLIVGCAVLWTTNVCVSYGCVTAALSPSCVPFCALVLVTLYDMRMQVNLDGIKKEK